MMIGYRSRNSPLYWGGLYCPEFRGSRTANEHQNDALVAQPFAAGRVLCFLLLSY